MLYELKMNEMIGSQKGKERDELDFYATHFTAVEKLCELENIKNMSILENSAGNGHIVKVLEREKYKNQCYTIDIVERDFKLDKVKNFLEIEKIGKRFDFAIYNPPFKHLIEFVKHTFNFVDKQWVFGRIQVLESKKRYEELFKNNWLKKVYVFSHRMSCAKGGIEEEFFKNNSMVFCWFLFDKNNTEKATVEWITFN